MKLKFATAALVVVIMGLFAPAQAQPPKIQIDQPLQVEPINTDKLGRLASAFFVKTYADALEKKFQGKSVGYSIVVTHSNGARQERAGGLARRAPDPNPRAMSVNDRYNIASVSKTITAAAVLKLLHEKNISVDAPIHPYLPSSWTLGPNVKTITFRQLLTHRAGIRCGGEVTYDNLKSCIAGGINLADKTEWKYNNSNFGLFRILIPHVASPGLSVPPFVGAASFYGTAYMSYVRNKVFQPAGLGTDIHCKPIADNPALTYQFPAPVIKGESFGDMSTTNASRGWNMSSKQLVTFMNTLLFTDKILPVAVREQMKSQGLGLYGSQLTPTLTSYEHGGYYPGKQDNGNLYNNGELNSLIIGFSNNISVAVIVNSQYGPNQSVSAAVKETMKAVLN
jgi:CubicO group peptidase (beta-lactamase class C family)